MHPARISFADVLLFMPLSASACRNPSRPTDTHSRKRYAARQARKPTVTHAALPAKQQQNPSVALPSTAFSELPVQPDRIFPVAIAAVAGISWYLWRQMKNAKEQKAPTSRRGGLGQFDASLESANAQDGREYRMALARTRQAVAIHRALGFFNSNNTARAMVELRRALHENSVCRSPLLNTQHEAAQLQQLYRLHLENTAQPADFATLLQLRTLLDLDFDVAEKMERDVMEQESAYII